MSPCTLIPAFDASLDSNLSERQSSAASCPAVLTSTKQQREIELCNHQGYLHSAQHPIPEQRQETETARSYTCKLCVLNNKGSQSHWICDCWGLLGISACTPWDTCGTPNGQAGCYAAESSLAADPLARLLQSPTR